MINTDDPGLFGTTLNREYELLADALGLSPEALTQIAANGFSHNWQPR
jgi:adenosine deaminase